MRAFTLALVAVVLIGNVLGLAAVPNWDILASTVTLGILGIVFGFAAAVAAYEFRTGFHR